MTSFSPNTSILSILYGYSAVQDLLNKAQRPILIQISRANRTISTAAAQVIARQMPYDLRCRILVGRDYLDASHDGEDEAAFGETEARADWQQRWEEITESQPGFWTRNIIPILEPWLTRKHGDMTYPLSQPLSGHGSFMGYLKRIGKTQTD